MSVSDSSPGLRYESHVAPVFRGVVAGVPEQVDVSIVMPCLNEADALRDCIHEATTALMDLGLTGEVLVVDNGSSDGSIAVAMAAGARVVEEAERGYGSACRRGLTEARGRFIVLGDADGTYDFTQLPSFVNPLLNGADMVIGNRLNSSMEAGAMPWLHRWVGNPFLTWVMNTLFSTSIGDAHCGLRSITRQSLLSLRLSAPGMEFASEFLIEALQNDVRIDQVPIRYRLRHGGRPKLRTFRDGWRHLGLLVSRWSKARHPANDEKRGAGLQSGILGIPDLTGRGEPDADRIRL